VAETALLPCAYKGHGGAGVAVSRHRGGEREPTACALAAALDRPGGRGAAARAARRPNRSQSAVAGRTEPRGRPTAGDTARRQQEIDEPRRSRYGANCHVSVTARPQMCD
jgi:hypothetical protein